MTSPAAPPLTADFEPRLNLFDATMIVMGAIIGAGIFFTPQTIAGHLDAPGAVFAVWLAGGLIAMAGATAYGELGAMLPHAGGQYVFLREAYGGLVAFLYGWVLLLAIVSGAIALVAVTFAQYLGHLVPLGGPHAEAVVAIGVIAVLTIVNLLGIRPGSFVQNVFTVLKIGALVGLTAAGLSRGEPGRMVPLLPGGLSDAPSFVGALAAVLFSFGGWQNLTYVAAEVRRPERNVPLAILAGVAGVTILYLLANFAFMALLPLETIAGTRGFAAEGVRRAFGHAGGQILAAAICCSTFGIINVLILATPRVYYAMAKDGVFFRQAGVLHARFRTPVLSILVQGIASSAFVALADASALLNYVVFADWVFFGLTGLSLILLRRRGVAPGSSYRALGYPFVPLAFVFASFGVVAGLVWTQWANARWGLLLLAAGVPVFLAWRRIGTAEA